MDTATRDLMKFRLDNNLRAVHGNGDAQYRIEEVRLDGASAFVTTCLYDTVVIFDIADPANPTDDIIYNEEKNSYEIRWEMRQVGDHWYLFERVDLRSLKDGDLCAF